MGAGLRQGGIAAFVALAAFAILPAAASADSVKHTGSFQTLIRNDPPPPDGGTPRCTFLNVFQWAELPGADFYTINIDDTQGFGGTSTYPPYTGDGEVEGFPPVANGLHRVALNSGSGPGPCTSDSLSRWSLTSMTANFDSCEIESRAGPSQESSLQDASRTPFQRSKGKKCADIVGTVSLTGGGGVDKVPISISGEKTVNTNSYGIYGTKVKSGHHTVTAPKGFCVQGVAKCSRSKSVNVKENGVEAVNFVRSDDVVTLSGSVQKRECIDPAFPDPPCEADDGDLVPASFVRIDVFDAEESGTQYQTTTDPDGNWELEVPAGKYSIQPETLKFAGVAGERPPTPRTLTVDAQKDAKRLDFKYCEPAPSEEDPAGCDLVKVSGKVVDIRGKPYEGAVAAGPGDAGPVDSKGRFSLLLPRRRVVITAVSGASALPRDSVSLDLTRSKGADNSLIQAPLALEPAALVPTSSPGHVYLVVDGLPLSDGGFEAEIKRGKPSPSPVVCRNRELLRFQRGKVVDDPTTPGTDPFLSSAKRGAQVLVTPSLSAEFCPADYRAAIYEREGGRRLAMTTFTVAAP